MKEDLRSQNRSYFGEGTREYPFEPRVPGFLDHPISEIVSEICSDYSEDIRGRKSLFFKINKYTYIVTVDRAAEEPMNRASVFLDKIKDQETLTLSEARLAALYSQELKVSFVMETLKEESDF